MLLTHIVLLAVALQYCMAGTDDVDELLNSCLDGRHHKERPGPEGSLFLQCTPWKDRSCCTYNTSKNLHQPRFYGFNYNHCSEVKNMSEECRRHFIQDNCFYECSPNIGPWVVKVDMKIRKERYYQVPLCESDCEAWFDACQHEYTCTDNWIRNFIWEKRGGNKCLAGTECRTFQKVYGTAANFCQKVWDDSWKVVRDSEACMRLWFDSSSGNPNDNVAKDKVQQMRQHFITNGLSIKQITKAVTVRGGGRICHTCAVHTPFTTGLDLNAGFPFSRSGGRNTEWKDRTPTDSQTGHQEQGPEDSRLRSLSCIYCPSHILTLYILLFKF